MVLVWSRGWVDDRAGAVRVVASVAAAAALGPAAVFDVRRVQVGVQHYVGASPAWVGIHGHQHVWCFALLNLPDEDKRFWL